MISAKREGWFAVLVALALLVFGYGVYGAAWSAGHLPQVLLAAIIMILGVVLFFSAWRVGTKGLEP